MAQRKGDRVRQTVQADAKSRRWETIKETSSTHLFTFRVPQADADILLAYFRKQGQTTSQGLRAILNNFIDTRIGG